MKLAAFLLLATAVVLEAGTTTISQNGEQRYINGSLTFSGTKLAGLLPNARMANAIFNDVNSSTAGYWRYPDTGTWDQYRNTREFVAQVPAYRAKGLLACSIDFQGGKPIKGATSDPWDDHGFNADGSLNSGWITRMDSCIRALDKAGMVAIVGYFYWGQDQRLSGETAIKNACWNATAWITSQGYTNVLIEIANETDAVDSSGVPGSAYNYAILRPDRIGELVSQTQIQLSNAGKRIPVAVSYRGSTTPPSAMTAQEGFILLHTGSQSVSGLTNMVNTVRARATHKPIVINEDSTDLSKFAAAVNLHVSWGYHDFGTNNYRDGFQSPPINWAINTATKQNFFNQLASYASSP